MTATSEDRSETATTFLLGVVVFGVYAAGACRTIYVGDSGELVTAAYRLGIPHPSGYPLYVLAGKLWASLVPLGTVAFRMSLFSAACGATAVSLLYRLVRSIGSERLPALFAAALLAFGPTFWAEANVQRVYTLNALFVVLVTTAAWRWFGDRKRLSLILVYFLCGLGATNHMFMAVQAFAVTLFVLVSEPELFRRPWRFAAPASAMIVGLLPYLYLPLRSRADPRLDWGNPETLPELFRVMTRRGFWERAWVEGPLDALRVAGDYLLGLGAETLWIGLVAAIIGAFVLRSRGWFAVLAPLVMALNLLVVGLHGSRSDIFLWHRYYIPSYVMLALLAGVGCDALVRRRSRIVQALPMLLPALLLVTGWQDHDRSRYRIAEDFSRQLLASLPPGAHLAASDDNILFVLMYLHLVENVRPDVDLVLQGVGIDLPNLNFDPDRESLFFTHHPSWSGAALEPVPVGLAFRALRAGDLPPEPADLPDRLEGELDPGVPKDYLTRNLIGHFHFMRGITYETRDWRRAALAFREAGESAADNDVLFYNLGLIYRRNGLLDEAGAAFQRCHEINPRRLASRGDVRAADRLAELDAERDRIERIESRLADELELRGTPANTPEWHRGMAEGLSRQGEREAARGHRLRSLDPASP